MLKQVLAISLIAIFALPSHAADPDRSYVVPPKSADRPAPPYSEAVMAGETLYVAGHIGFDSATGRVPANVDDEIRAVLDGVKQTLEKAGLKTDDLVSVTVYCTDLELFDKFNTIYRSYFHGQFPARAFIGVNKLLAGAHFEVAGTAVKAPGTRKL
jgi:2-iminobutanoate/2-iminopropanoate deaminase